jgi:HemY protein
MSAPTVLFVLARMLAAGAEGRMREWLDRAVTAVPDPRYVCADCGAESLEWHSLCPNCGAFDTLSWRTPARAPFVEPAAIAAQTAKPPPPETPIAALPAAAEGEC